MRKAIFIGLVAFIVTACGTTSTAPLDDTYYWPDGRQVEATNDTIP